MSLKLHCNSFGKGGPPLLIMHGLLGSARNWATIAKDLGQDHHVFALDLRNHGASPWADAMTYDEMAADVHGFIARRRLGPVILMGHSMGGKVAMWQALTEGESIAALIVVDIAPVPYAHSFDAYIDAMRSADLAHATRRSQVEDALRDAAPDTATRLFLLQNLVRREGGFAWRVNLDALQADMDDITGWPDPEERRFEGPTLFITGERSDYVEPGHRADIMDLFPQAQIVTIKDAGHRVHAEQPEAYLATVRAFLDAVHA